MACAIFGGWVVLDVVVKFVVCEMLRVNNLADERNPAFSRGSGRASACHGQQWAMCYERAKELSTMNGRILSSYTITAREAHLCGERGSPAAGRKSCVCGLGMPAKRGQATASVAWWQNNWKTYLSRR